MKKRKNLLVLGASGGVANAFLHYLVHHRNLFNKLILLDKNKKVLTDAYIDHNALNYKFIHKKLDLPKKEKEYINILKDNEIDIVIDITDMDTLPVIYANNKAGVSLINTAMNGEGSLDGLVFELFNVRNKLTNAANIFFCGMNPGVVNMWVRYGIEKFGVPKEIVHFEYDTSKIAKKWQPAVTWSIEEFIVEAIKDPGGIVLGKRKVKNLYPNALEHRKNMENLFSPIFKLKKYPEGFEVLHEENLTIAEKYNVPSKFIYAINTRTMENLIKIYEKNKKVLKKDLIKADNTEHPLGGSDNIGVFLDYLDKRVYYFNSSPNINVIGTNGTYMQVIIGIFAGLFTLVFDDLKPGVYFPEDLFENHFKYYLFDNMRVEEFVFNKKNGKLIMKNYNPFIKIKRPNHFEHMYI